VLASLANLAPQVNKIRQVASSLLSEQTGPLRSKAQEYLHDFVNLITKLDRGPGSMSGENGHIMTDEEMEEREFRTWSDLMEYQERFVKAGGFLSEL
jgi:hypothetical protein